MSCCRSFLLTPGVLATVLCTACGDVPDDDEPQVNVPIAIGSRVLAPEQVFAYLADSLGFTSRGGTVFCSYGLLGVRGDRAYLETVCEELLAGPDSLESGSGAGRPVALRIDTVGPARIAGHETPGDGNRYARDVRRIFPPALAERILARRSLSQLREANRSRVRAADLQPTTALVGSTRGEELTRAAEQIIAFLRGESTLDPAQLADTVTLYLAPEGGGARRAVTRAQLLDPAQWHVVEPDFGHSYPFRPPPRLTELTTRVGRHLRCTFDQPLAEIRPELARLPHVGTLLQPQDAESCLQSWNVTFVFDADARPPRLVAAIYDQWEW